MAPGATSSRSSRRGELREVLAGQAGRAGRLASARGRWQGRDVGSPWATLAAMGLLDGWRFCPALRSGARAPRCRARSRARRAAYVAWANSVPGAQALDRARRPRLLGRRATTRGGLLGPSRRLPRGGASTARRPAPRGARGDRSRDRAGRVPRHVDAAVRRAHRAVPHLAARGLTGGEERAGGRRDRARAGSRPTSCPPPASSRSRPYVRPSLWRARHEHA